MEQIDGAKEETNHFLRNIVHMLSRVAERKHQDKPPPIKFMSRESFRNCGVRNKSKPWLFQSVIATIQLGMRESLWLGKNGSNCMLYISSK